MSIASHALNSGKARGTYSLFHDVISQPSCRSEPKRSNPRCQCTWHNWKQIHGTIRCHQCHSRRRSPPTCSNLPLTRPCSSEPKRPNPRCQCTWRNLKQTHGTIRCRQCHSRRKSPPTCSNLPLTRRIGTRRYSSEPKRPNPRCQCTWHNWKQTHGTIRCHQRHSRRRSPPTCSNLPLTRRKGTR